MLLPEAAIRILRALPEAALFVTARGQILAANATARESLHLGQEQASGRNLAELVEDSAAELAATLRTWSRSSEPTPGSLTIKSASTPTTFDGRGAAISPSSEEGPAVLLVRFWPRAEANPFILLNQKITELNDEVARRVQVEEALRRSEAALKDRVREAEALNRSKDEFLATVSHELRTPLNAILGWSALLKGGRLGDQKVDKALQVIHRNAESQAKLIEDILDVSRVISGKLLLEPSSCDLVAIVEEAIEVVRPSVAAKELELVFVRPDEACLLIADPDRLRQVVWNLLSNAVKFTDRGGRIRAEVQRSGSQFALSVTDTGCGIDGSFLPFVFDRFRQADGSTTRRVGGLGLGLALVRHIVELHGGSVHARSEGLGMGARFSIQLPIRAVTPVALPSERRPSAFSEAMPPAPVSLVGVRVLVVDDEEDARELLSALLTQAGGEVATASSAKAAIEELGRFHPQVLVSDIGMPDEDGYSLVRKLHQLSAGKGIPAVALTAYTRAEDRAQALAAGFTTHIGKPVNPHELVQVVKTLAASACG